MSTEISSNDVALATAIESQINDTIRQIADGAISPKDSHIGRLFARLRQADPNRYAVALSAYRPVSDSYFSQHGRSRARQMELEVARIAASLSDIPDEDVEPEERRGRGRPKTTVRPSRPEPSGRKVHHLKDVDPMDAPPGRAAYEFEGEVYGKGPLVLAMVASHARRNPGITYDDMKRAFPDELLRTYGVFARRADAERKSVGPKKRYFIGPTQVIVLADCEVCVCNQITADILKRIINQARRIGLPIKF